MGCSSTRQKPAFEINSNDELRTGIERVFFTEKYRRKSWRLNDIYDKAPQEGPLADQKKIELLWKDEEIEHSLSEDLKSEGSLTKAIASLEFSEISRRKTSSSSICLQDVNEGAWDVPIRFKPNITWQSQRNVPNLGIVETKGQDNFNFLNSYARMNSGLTYNSPSRQLIRQNSGHDIYALQLRKANDFGHKKNIVQTNVISGYKCGHHNFSGNCRYATNHFGGGKSLRVYRISNSLMKITDSACKSMQTSIPEYGKDIKMLHGDTTSFDGTVLEYDSSMETVSNDHLKTEDAYKTSGTSEENPEYPENKLSLGLSTRISVYPPRKTVRTQEIRALQLLL